MSISLAKLVAALPGEDERSQEAMVRAALEDLFVLGQRPVPTTTFRRFWALGGLQAHIALAYFAYWIRSWFSNAGRAKQELLEANLSAAFEMLVTMGYLRGAVMKLGQTLANYPDVVPNEFVATLERLHFDAPPMHFSLLREYIYNELGDDPEAIFDSFETEAFAAASLGQVHRAQLKSGEKVAVKIQYPGIARTIRSDMSNLYRLMLPLRITKDWENLKDQIAEVRQVLEIETDYEREAGFLRKARQLFADNDGIVVPRVFEEYSTKRVLTMELIDGVHLNEFLAKRPSQELRNAFAEKMVRAWSRVYYAGHMNYNDLNPGNFIFCKDGRLGFIDFGCIREYTDEDWKWMERAHRAMHGSNRDLREFVADWGEIRVRTKSDEERLKLYEEHCQWCWAPVRTKAPFDFSDEKHMRKGFELIAELTRKRYVRNRPMGVFITRFQLGYHALLYRLRARLDMQSIDREEATVTGWQLA